MKRYAVLASLMLFSGCQSYVDAEAEYTAYRRCSHSHAVRFSSQEGDALTLAAAAEASCPGETNALLLKMNEAKGPGGALRLMRAIRDETIRSNAATIVKLRS